MSVEVKRKLNLKCIPHPTPYQVSWLQKGQQVNGTEQCLLSFQIGNFSKQILNDVVEMDTCHVLLGRPWMFDKKVFHDCRENTYEFIKDRECYKFLPIIKHKMDCSNKKNLHNSNNRFMIYSAKEFLREHKRGGCC